MLSQIVTAAQCPHPIGTWEHFISLKDIVGSMKSASWDSNLGIGPGAKTFKSYTRQGYIQLSTSKRSLSPADALVLT